MRSASTTHARRTSAHRRGAACSRAGSSSRAGSTRSTDECEMSRSCHSATFSSPACALPRSTRARPAMRSDMIGLRLCGIALEPFCARPGTAPRPRAPRCAAGGGPRWRSARGRRPASAIACSSSAWRSRAHHLRRDRLARAARAARAPAPRSRGRAPRRCRPRPRSRPTDACANARSSRSALRCGLEGEAGELQPERRRLGVHAVRAPDAQRRPVLARPLRPAPSTSSRAPASDHLAGLRAAAAPAPVSSTSEEVSPKWIQRPAGPADAASTSTNAATSWSVTRSRSCDRLDRERRAADRLEVLRRARSGRRRAPRTPATSTSRQRLDFAPRRSRSARARGGCSERSLPRRARMRAASTAALRALSTPDAGDRARRAASARSTAARRARRPTERLGGQRHADHRQVGVRGDDARAAPPTGRRRR